MKMHNRMKKHALSVVAYTAKRFANGVPVFIDDGEPFFGRGDVHIGKIKEI
jgi:hypothetical protein